MTTIVLSHTGTEPRSMELMLHLFTSLPNTNKAYVSMICFNKKCFNKKGKKGPFSNRKQRTTPEFCSYCLSPCLCVYSPFVYVYVCSLSTPDEEHGNPFKRKQQHKKKTKQSWETGIRVICRSL